MSGSIRCALAWSPYTKAAFNLTVVGDEKTITDHIHCLVYRVKSPISIFLGIDLPGFFGPRLA